MIGAGLTLVTGNTGSGKTALVVKWLTQTKDRPLFVMGIPELKVEHFECPPVEQWTEQRKDPDDPSLLLPYFTFPANSIVVLDEAQRVYRPRPVGSRVPDIVAAFETRRHTGVDFVVMTQDHTFIDANLRKLVTRHIHIHQTALGSYKLEWVGCGDPREASSRDLAQRERYSPPKEVFGLYKSAEIHTKRVVRRPWLVYAAVPLFLGVGGGVWYVKHRVDATMNGETTKTSPVSGRVTSGPIQGAANGESRVPLTKQEYVQQYQPRFEGMTHTAPVYDELTKPVDVPIIAGCVASARTGCKCYDQRGNRYQATDAICQQFMNGGIFYDFRAPEQAPATAAENPGKPSNSVLNPGLKAEIPT